MDPTNQPIQQPAPQEQNPVPVPEPTLDYLNQIAPQAPKKMRFSLLQIILIAIGAIALIVIISLIISYVANIEKNNLQRLAARLQTTEKIVGDAQSKITNTSLRALNSNLKIYLTNTNRDIEAPLLKQNIKISKLDKNIVGSETGTDMSNRLEEARLNAVFDRTYAREIAYKLATIIALMKKIEAASGSKSLKSFIKESIDSLEPTQNSFEDFNATNG